MRSTFAGLNTMVSGLNANQIALDTVGHNITNAGNTGYSRQRANASATKPEKIYTYYGASQIGTGTSVESITRARDEFADKQYWKENSNLKEAESEQYVLGKVETVFEEPTDSSLQTVLNKFWKSFQTLSTNASNYSTRVEVRDTGKEIVNSIDLAQSQLKDLISDNNSSLELKKDSINQITEKILQLNKQIVTIENSGSGYANDLRDSRDLLVDELSTLVNVNVTEKANGSYSISSNGMTLVDADARSELTITSTNDPDYGIPIYKIADKATGVVLTPLSGEVKGYYDATNQVKDYLNQTTTMVAFFLKEFNYIHKAGFGLNNETGNNFFGTDLDQYGNGFDYSLLAYNAGTAQWSITEYTGGTAVLPATGATITISSTDILKQFKVNSEFDAKGGTDLIAAKSANTEGEASGTNALKLAQAFSTATGTTLGSVSLNSYYTGLTGSLGTTKKAVDRSVENLTTTLTQIEGWRKSTSGVNWDEELTNMLTFQKGYSASSRVLTTMDEMLDKLINGTGVVGR